MTYDGSCGRGCLPQVSEHREAVTAAAGPINANVAPNTRERGDGSLTEALNKVVGVSRALVLRALQGGPMSVGEIVRLTGLSQPNVSNHLGRLREQGLVVFHREGKRLFYEMANPELVRTLLAMPSDVALSDADVAAELAALAPQFEEAALGMNEEGARLLINRALAHGVPWQALYLGVFSPTLEKVGALWACGALSVSEEHASSQLVDRIMHHVAALRVPALAGPPAEIVVACAEGEQHDIGARMLADFVSAAGYNVVFLGADVPNDALITYVVRYQPELLCVSATMAHREEALRDLANRLDALPAGTRRPRLLLGGALIEARPDLPAECRAVQVPPTIPGALSALNGRSHKA